MIFGKKKNKKLSPEQLQKNLEEYGTNNHDEIKKIIDSLDKRYYKTRCNNLDLIFGKIDNHTHMMIVHTLARRHKIIARERITLKTKNDQLCPTEEILINLDKKILDSQLVKQGYTLETRKTIIENIRKNYSTTNYDLYSNNIDDYNIDKNFNVAIKPAKERYQNALKANEEENQKLLNKNKIDEEKTI